MSHRQTRKAQKLAPEAQRSTADEATRSQTESMTIALKVCFQRVAGGTNTCLQGDYNVRKQKALSLCRREHPQSLG